MIKWQICNNLKVTMSLCLNDPGNNTISWNGCHDLSWVQLLHVQIYVCVQCTCILWLCPHEFCMSMSDMYCFALVCVYIYVYIIYIFYIQQIWIYIAIHIYIYIHVSIWEQAPENKIFWEKKKRQSPCSMHFFQRFIGSSWAWNLLPICNSLVPRWKTHFPSRRERMHTVGAPTKWAKYDSLQHSM